MPGKLSKFLREASESLDWKGEMLEDGYVITPEDDNPPVER